MAPVRLAIVRHVLERDTLNTLNCSCQERERHQDCKQSTALREDHTDRR